MNICTYNSSSSLHNEPQRKRAKASQYPSPVYKKRSTTYFELASILTESFTCARVGFCAGASFLPPVASRVSPTVPKMVPRARYSFLIARPRMTLLIQAVQDRASTGGHRKSILGHGGGEMVVTAGGDTVNTLKSPLPEFPAPRVYGACPMTTERSPGAPLLVGACLSTPSASAIACQSFSTYCSHNL